MCVLIHRALYYQRRWVKLDVDYLRYFDSDKVTTHPYRKMCHIVTLVSPRCTDAMRHTVLSHSNSNTHNLHTVQCTYTINHTQNLHSEWWDLEIFNRVAVVVCRRYILRGPSQQPSSPMWAVWGSSSLRSPQTTEHLSSGLKVKVCLYCRIICVLFTL